MNLFDDCDPPEDQPPPLDDDDPWGLAPSELRAAQDAQSAKCPTCHENCTSWIIDDAPCAGLAFPFEKYPENGLYCPRCDGRQRVTSDGPVCANGHRGPGWTEERRAKAKLESHCREDPGPIGCCAGPDACSCECNTCLCPNCETNPCACLPMTEAEVEALRGPPTTLARVRVSHSELAMFRSCPRKHFYAYRLRRESRTTAAALLTGRRVEVPVKQILLGNTPDLTGLEPPERALVQAYALRWKNSELEVDGIDVPFEVEVLDSNITLVGELDAVGKQHRRRVLVEIKTTGEDISPGSGYWNAVTHMNPQVTNYLLAAKSYGWEASFMVWDALRKPLLKKHLATPEAERKYTKITKTEPVSRLYANQRAEDETDADFEIRILEDIAENPDFYFARQTVVRFEAEHEAHVRDLNGTVHLMQTVAQMEEAPRNVDACFKYGSACSYLPVCSGETKIDDDTRYADRKRRAVTPSG